MAQQRRSRPNSNRNRTRKRKPVRQTKPLLSRFRRKEAEFRQDKESSSWTKYLHLTHAQRDRLLKWGSYVLLLILLLVIQDVIMSRVPIFGITTDLMAAIILLITVIEGVQTGSMFALVASSLYYFSGSSPGPYTVALLTVLGILACIFRQLYWHRNLSSIVLCAGIALMLYEVITFGLGMFNGITYWGRVYAFVSTGLLSWLLMIPLYPLINVLGQIGGNTWKE